MQMKNERIETNQMDGAGTENNRVPGTEIQIDHMQKKDAAEVAAIEKQIFSMPWSENGFLTSLQSEDTLYLVARRQNRIVGYCGLLQSFEEADITNVAVAPKERGRGIAFAMLTSLMTLGKERGIERFTLEVRSGNAAAIHLYEKLGFASVGVRKNFYDKPKEDAVIMWTE